VVAEWVGGETLTDLVADGPLDPGRACLLVADAARAVAGAHAAGQAHLRLTPETLRWTRSSGVKITGLGIDAALADFGPSETAESDPTVTDTRDLAALLYAALTGYWPGKSQTGLPPAPVSDGVVCTPRQVTADVPQAVDSLVCRALLHRAGRQGPPILAAGEFADALSSVAPPVPLPDPAPPLPRGNFEPSPRYDYAEHDGYAGYQAGYTPDPDDPASWALPGRGRGGPPTYQQRYPAPARGGASRALLGVVVVLVIAAVVATALVIGKSLQKSGSHKAGGTPSAKASTAPAGSTVLKPAGVDTFNILGTDDEDAVAAPLAIDIGPGSLKTAWTTEYYKDNPKFGGLKSGTGLLLDMGRPVRLSQVGVLFGSKCCTTAEIYLGNSNAKSRSALNEFKLVAPSAVASGNHVFETSGDATGRYVLIWITSLPPKKGSANQFQALIYNVIVRGAAVSGAS